MSEPTPTPTPTDRMLQVGQMVYDEFRKADIALNPKDAPMEGWLHLDDKTRAKWAMASLIAVNVGKLLAIAKARQIMEDADDIRIRDEVNGERGTYKLVELPVEQAIRHLLRFVESGRGPLLAVEQEEGGGTWRCARSARVTTGSSRAARSTAKERMR